jgi:hypothetical protein
LRFLTRQANQEFFFIRKKAKPNKNAKIPTYIMSTSLVVVSGSSICSSSVNDDYKINNPYKDAYNILILASIKQCVICLPTAIQITHPFVTALKPCNQHCRASTFPVSCRHIRKWAPIMSPCADRSTPTQRSKCAKKYTFSGPGTTQRNITENTHPFTDMDQPNHI